MRFFFGVYWGARPESLEQSVDRCIEYFNIVNGISSHTKAWFNKGSSPRAARKMLNTHDSHAIRECLNKGINRRDLDQSIIPELGWSISLWNGEVKEYVGEISILCGSHSQTPGIYNSATLNLRYWDEGFTNKLDCKEMLISLLDAWSASKGIFKIDDNVVFQI